MKTRNLIITTLLTVSVSGAANAAPSGLDEILSRFVTAAISATTEEIKNEVTEAILNSAHHIEQGIPSTSVEITDLPADESSED